MKVTYIFWISVNALHTCMGLICMVTLQSAHGPVYSFWCFAFERMNGMLGSYHVNNHHISIQLTRRFLNSKLYCLYNPYLHLFNAHFFRKICLDFGNYFLQVCVGEHATKQGSTSSASMPRPSMLPASPTSDHDTDILSPSP